MKNVLKTLFLFVSLGSASLSFCMGAKSPSDPEVVSDLDLTRYVGEWQEIAHSKNYFQRNCERSIAEYQVIDEHSISVFNKCYKNQMLTGSITGKATIVDPAVPAKLRVRFNFFARGDYWITHLDDSASGPYQWAVVSGPQKKPLFILARSFPMDTNLKERLLAQLAAEGFDLSKLVFDF